MRDGRPARLAASDAAVVRPARRIRWAAGPRLWAWTYAASQKVRNLERDRRATLQVEAGELYQELRGVMLECDVSVHRDVEIVKRSGTRSSLATPPRAAAARRGAARGGGLGR